MAKKTDVEILAPAGSPDCLKAAIINGAGAVYLGVGTFNARAKAENFTAENLKEWVDYAHLFGVKVYLTLNILLKNSELKAAVATAARASRDGVDAVIVQDLGLAAALKRELPQLELHASTQMGIHNLEGALFAERLGFSQVVLSRETLLADVKRIRDNCSLKLEAFVQGAQCVSFSGSCYFSSLVSGCSGNRGRCLQLCRKKYSLREKYAETDYGQKYWLSPKDLCRAEIFDTLADAGITSLKIEGRMRRPEYVAESVRIYKKALTGEFLPSDLDCLKKTFNRGDYTPGYIEDKKPDIMYPFIQGHMGLNIGKVLSVKNSVAHLSCRINSGDGLKFLRRSDVGVAEVGTAEARPYKGDTRTTTFAGAVRTGDEVYLTTDSAYNKEILTRKRKIKITVSVDIFRSCPVRVLIENAERPECGAFSYESEETVQPAKSAPLTDDTVIKAFAKSADTVFEPEVKVRTDGKSFMPLAALNQARREAYDAYNMFLLDSYSQISKKSTKTPYLDTHSTMSNIVDFKPAGIILQVEDLSRLDEKVAEQCAYISLNPRDYSCLDFNNPNYIRLKDKLILNLPVIARDGDIDILKKAIAGFDYFIINSVYGFELLKGKKVLLGTGLNLLNDGFMDGFTKICPIESDTVPAEDDYLYYYGSPAAMTLCHCFNRAAASAAGKTMPCKACKSGNQKELTLTDDKNHTYSIRTYKVADCYSQMLFGPIQNTYYVRHNNKFIDLTGIEPDAVSQTFFDVLEGKTIGAKTNLTRGLQ